MLRRVVMFAGLIALCTQWFAGRATANDLSKDEQIVFFPTYAATDAKPDQVTLFVHGWIYELELDSLARNYTLTQFCSFLGLEKDACAQKIFVDRARQFLVD